MWDKCNSAIVWTFFGIAFLWDWNENWLFQSCGHCWVFQLFWHIECHTFTASSFRIWNSSAGILSPPLTLFVVMLPKAHLTSHSRMSGSRWVIMPSWLPGSLRSFLYSSVYSFYLFLICMYIYMCVCVCVCVCIYICICIYIYMCNFKISITDTNIARNSLSSFAFWISAPWNVNSTYSVPVT